MEAALARKRALLGAQRRERVHACRSPRRNPAREQAREKKRRGDDGVRRGIEAPDLEEQAREVARQHGGADGSDRETGGGQREPFAG